MAYVGYVSSRVINDHINRLPGYHVSVKQNINKLTLVLTQYQTIRDPEPIGQWADPTSCPNRKSLQMLSHQDMQQLFKGNVVSFPCLARSFCFRHILNCEQVSVNRVAARKSSETGMYPSSASCTIYMHLRNATLQELISCAAITA